MNSASRCTAFVGSRRLASGDLSTVALAVRHAADQGTGGPLLIIDDATGSVIDVDLRGSDADILARLKRAEPTSLETKTRRPGRPTLGVVGREVTLLPRHWEWLAAQPGGASVTLRRLVDAARHGSTDAERTRQAHERAFRFMSAIAGDLPGFEEAIRALFASDRAGLEARVASWPSDIASHAVRLAFGDAPATADHLSLKDQ